MAEITTIENVRCGSPVVSANPVQQPLTLADCEMWATEGPAVTPNNIINSTRFIYIKQYFIILEER